MEFVGRHGVASAAEQIVFFSLQGDVTETLQGRGHEGFARYGADPGPQAVLAVAKGLMEIHESPTFSDARQLGGQGTAKGCAHRRVLAQGPGIQFGIAAAEIETVTRRQFPVVKGTEKDQVRAGLLQDLEAVFIIETEGFVPGDGQDGPARIGMKGP